MDTRKELHISRLKTNLDQIDTIKEINAFHGDFSTWKSRIVQSLTELYGKENGYTKRFLHLSFWATRIGFGRSVTWSSNDQKIYNDDVNEAKQILIDALEEIQFIPTIQQTPASPSKFPPQIVINVKNVLSQTNQIQFSQIISNIDVLDLNKAEKEQAKLSAEELSKEINGSQRWHVLAKSLDTLKRLGKQAYEQIAIPLLLEMLKKQTGLL